MWNQLACYGAAARADNCSRRIDYFEIVTSAELVVRGIRPHSGCEDPPCEQAPVLVSDDSNKLNKETRSSPFGRCNESFCLFSNDIDQITHCQVDIDQMQAPISLDLTIDYDVSRYIIGARIFGIAVHHHCQI